MIQIATANIYNPNHLTPCPSQDTPPPCLRSGTGPERGMPTLRAIPGDDPGPGWRPVPAPPDPPRTGPDCARHGANLSSAHGDLG